MGKNNIFSGIITLIVILMILLSTFLVVNYTTGVLTAAVAFAGTDQNSKFQACGINVPTELSKLQADIPGLVLPAIYIGFPGLLILLSIMMFLAGRYYNGNGKEEQSSSETTTTTSSPARVNESGDYESGTKVEEKRTQKSSKSEGK